MANEQLRFEIIVDDKGSATIKKFGAQVQETTGQIDKMGNALSVIKWDSMINLAQQAYGAVKAMYDFGRSIADNLNAIERQSKVLGMSTTEFQQWTYAAKMADVESETLSMGFKLLSRNMSEAAQGTGNAFDAFQAMGLEVKGISGSLKPLDTVMKEIMDKFKGWTDGPQKIAIALALFGRSGEALIPLLNKGAIGFDEFAKEAAKLGIILDPSLIEAGGRAEDTFKKLEYQIQATKLSLIPVVQWFAEFIQSIVVESKKVIKALEDLAEAQRKASKAGKERQDEWRRERGYPTTDMVGKGLWPASGKEEMKRWAEAAELYEKTWGVEALAAQTPAPSLLGKVHEPLIVGFNEVISAMHPYINALNELGIVSDRFLIHQAKSATDNFAVVKEAYKKGEATLRDYLNAFDAVTLAKQKIDPLEQAFSKLGVTSEQNLKITAERAVTNLSIIRTAFEQGKISVNDYVQAIRAVKKAMDDLAGPDTLQQEIVAGEEWSKQMKGINKDEEDWRKKEAAYTDDYMKKLEEINKLKKASFGDIPKALDELSQVDQRLKTMGIYLSENPFTPIVDISKTDTAFENIDKAYLNLKSNIESNPINVQMSGGGVGAGGGSPPVGDYGGAWDANLGNKLTANVAFTATGMSPKMPLGDALEKLAAEFGGIKGLITGLEAEISFDKTSRSLAQAEKELANYTKQYNDFYAVMSRQWSKPEVRMFEGKGYTRDEFYDLMQDAMYKVDILKKEQLLSILGSYQGGGVIPKTGLAFLHEGERVTPKHSSVSMGGITINTGKGTSKEQAMEVIREIQKALKYKQVQMN